MLAGCCHLLPFSLPTMVSPNIIAISCQILDVNVGVALKQTSHEEGT